MVLFISCSIVLPTDTAKNYNNTNLQARKTNSSEGIKNAMQKSYEDFITALWTYECSIDPSRQAWYNENWNSPVIQSYPKVLYPGRVVRDPATGNPVEQYNMTVKEYFTAIGVVDLYDPVDPNPDWGEIQGSVINYLGFTGFQFQESDLVDLGYYKYKMSLNEGKKYPVHYVDVSNVHWKNGVTYFFDDNPAEVDVPAIVTDTVHFTDSLFTGKNNISSVADFKDPAKQIFIIKDHFVNKYAGIVDGLKARGETLSDYSGTVVTWDGLDPPVNPPPGGRENEVTITISGLLAGAHLRGAAGVVALLVDKQNPHDESGTYILQYVQDYAGYDTPFKPYNF